VNFKKGRKEKSFVYVTPAEAVAAK
jgi:hypothetical protein